MSVVAIFSTRVDSLRGWGIELVLGEIGSRIGGGSGFNSILFDVESNQTLTEIERNNRKKDRHSLNNQTLLKKHNSEAKIYRKV